MTSAMAAPKQAPVRPDALTLLRRSQHVLFVVLVGIGAVRCIADNQHPVAGPAAAVVVLAWYGVGVALAGRANVESPDVDPPARSRGQTRASARRVGAAWLGVLTLGCVELAVLSVDFVWTVFVLFLLGLQILGRRVGLAYVVVLTVAAIIAIALDRDRLDVAAVVGPVIGAAVAVIITRVYEGLRYEVQSRARLVIELTAAQEQIAATERRAGTLAERERLARELHDTVAQSLSSIVLLLRSARDAAPNEPTHEPLTTALDTARSALDDTRRIVRALTPSELSGRPLDEALQRAIDAVARLGVRGSLTVDGEPIELPTPVAVALLRVAQGAIANVSAHAGAHRVAVTLTYQPEGVRLDVADDGRGFEPAQPARSASTGSGVGLAAMRTRLAEVGGTLVVESAPGAGTAVSATIPTGDQHGD